MASFDNGVSPPGAASFNAPLLNFSAFGDLYNDYQNSQITNQQKQLNQQRIALGQQQQDLSKAFSGGLPIDPATGQIDYAKAAQILAAKGDPDAAVKLLQQQPAPMSPLFGGQPQGGQPQGQPQQQGAPQAQPSSSDTGSTAAKIIQVEGNGKNPKSSAEGVGQFTDSTWIDSLKKYFPNLAAGRSDEQLLAMRKIPQLATRVTEAFTAGNEQGLSKAGLPVTPATTYLAHFAGLGGAIKVLQANPDTPVSQILGQAAVKANPFLKDMTARDLEVWAAKKMTGPAMTAQNAAQAPQGAGGGMQVADASGNLPPSANAGTPAAQVSQQQPPFAAAGQPQGRPPQPQGQPQQQGGQQQPLVPQEPLPPGYTDPMKAVADLRMAAMREASDLRRGAKEQAQGMNAWADRIEAGLKPVSVNTNTSLVDPRTAKPVYEGAGAAAIRSGSESAASLDAAAEVFRQTGKLPPNMGRGIQGQAESLRVRERAAELETEAGGDPNDWSTRWQSFNAGAAGARVLATRATNLRLAENEASSLIPRVREASDKINRTQYPTLNSLILAAEKGTGGEDVVRYGLAVSSLIPVYARVLKPTGQITEGDTNRAREILDKAWSKGQINAALDQMQIELNSAKTALQKTIDEQSGKKKTESSSQGGTKKDADGWTTLPNGARIREITAGN